MIEKIIEAKKLEVAGLKRLLLRPEKKAGEKARLRWPRQHHSRAEAQVAVRRIHRGDRRGADCRLQQVCAGHKRAHGLRLLRGQLRIPRPCGRQDGPSPAVQGFRDRPEADRPGLRGGGRPRAPHRPYPHQATIGSCFTATPATSASPASSRYTKERRWTGSQGSIRI